MRLTNAQVSVDDDWPRDVLPFPQNARAQNARSAPRHDTNAHPSSTDDVLDAFDAVSRRINDLARELKCLGYFDDDLHRPRAA